MANSIKVCRNVVSHPFVGGMGVLFRFGSNGAVPLKPPNLYPSLRVIFGGKGYTLLGFFIQENDVFVYFSDEMGENI